METTAIKTHGKMDLAEFRHLPTLIETADEAQKRAFVQGLAEGLFDHEISDPEINIVIDVLVDLAVNYVPPSDQREASLRQR